MKWWPLVWRAEMEREVARAIQTNEMFVNDRDRAEERLRLTEKALVFEQKRNAELVERLLSLKMQGAVEVPKPVEPITVAGAQAMFRQALTEPDEMMTLIDQKAGSDLRKRAMMLRQLAADRAANVDEDTIRAAILTGIPSSGVPA